MNEDVRATASRIGATLFLPVRTLAGPLHRRRPALRDEQRQYEQELPPLPPAWSDPRWYRGDFPPRRHNQLVPLIHGDEYFADVCEALATARERITICGWSLTPLMPLLRGEREAESLLAHVLNEASRHADIYVLLWSGAPALFQPTIHEAEGVQNTLRRIAPRVRCVLDRRATFSHDHHQKAITVDGSVAYVGGMDLSTFQGDRWDTSDHRLRFGPNWHDIQVRARGEIVGDVEMNFCQRWNESAADHLEPLPAPAPDPQWDTPAQVVRTIPAGFYAFADKGHYGIHHALITAIQEAEHFIYLENQYIWAPEVVDALISAMNRPRQNPFRIVLVLPSHAYSGRYDNDRHVEDLRTADGGRGIFESYALYAGGPAAGRTGYRYNPIYVHAKVSIVDDAWFSIGSANLNRRGLGTDTEMNVQAISLETARRLRVRLWAEHLGVSDGSIGSEDLIELIDNNWKDVGQRTAGCIRAGSRPKTGQVVRYVTKRGAEGRVLDILQSMSLEH